MRIDIYRFIKNWVFDDSEFGLKKEAFIRGSSRIIDGHLKKMGRSSAHTATLYFEEQPFEGYQFVLRRKSEPLFQGGAWYQDEELGMTGWLCSNTLLYFKYFPDAIYSRIIA